MYLLFVNIFLQFPNNFHLTVMGNLYIHYLFLFIETFKLFLLILTPLRKLYKSVGYLNCSCTTRETLKYQLSKKSLSAINFLRRISECETTRRNSAKFNGV